MHNTLFSKTPLFDWLPPAHVALTYYLQWWAELH